MRITLFTDFRFANDPAPTGVLKHALYMARGLARSPDFEVSALVSADQVGQQGCLSFLPGKKLPLPWKVARELWTWTNRPVVDRWIGETDWVYCPKNDWIPVKRAKYAVTIHGAHEIDPDFNKPQGLREQALCYRTRRQYLKMCERADVVLTVSEWLKAFIVEQFRTDASKIVVVGNGVDECFYEAGRKEVLKSESSEVRKLEDGGRRTEDRRSALLQACERALVGKRGDGETVGNGETFCEGSTSQGGVNSEEGAVPRVSSIEFPVSVPSTSEILNSRKNGLHPYILCVGGLNFIDGGDRIIALGQEIKRSGRRIRIKVAGCQHDPGAQQLAAETGVIDLLGFVCHEHLAGWMADAATFYFPTRYETFGMAAAEAMAAGCPVVTSRCTAVPEIVGDCGVYVNPDNPAEVLDAVDVLLKDSGLSSGLIERAYKRAGLFTWNECTQRLHHSLRAT